MNGDAEISTAQVDAFGRTFVLLQRTRALDHAFSLWDAGLGFVRYLEANHKAAAAFEGRRVLELGAGCGLVSMVLAALGAHAVATDLPHVVPHLQSCIGANGFRLGLAPLGGASAGGGGSIDAAALPWGDAAGVEDVVARFGPFDAVVGTDVVYQDVFVRPLLRTAAEAALLSAAAAAGEGGRRRATQVFFGNEERDATTHALFERLAKELFGAKLVPPKSYHPDSEGTSLRIYEGRLKPGASREGVQAATRPPAPPPEGGAAAAADGSGGAGGGSAGAGT